MKFTSIYVDEHGHSYFGEVDLPQSGNERRVGARPQDVKYWRAGKMLPGHYKDFHTVEDIELLCVMAGHMELTVSNGERRYFACSDMVLLQDTTGQGHATRILGTEPCQTLHIAMPDIGDFTS